MDTEHVSAVPPHPVQFSLRSLFLALEIAGVLLTPIYWFGGFYVVSMVISLGLVASCLWAYRTDRRGTMFGLSILGWLASLPFLSIALALHALLNAIACAICILFKVRPKIAAGVLGVALVAAYGLIFWSARSEIERLNALQAKFPMVSLDKRLDFERRQAPNSHPRPKSLSDHPLSESVRANLASFEEHRDVDRYSRRGIALFRLHERTYQQFAIATGFGNSRMGRVHVDRVDLEPREPVRMPLAAGSISLRPSLDELDKLHLTANSDFLDQERMGYVRDRNHVAGFEAHAFTELSEQWNPNDSPPARWQVNRLELVSLLRHETPQVYVSNKLPKMDELAVVPHRSLNDFEQAALQKLASEQDLVVEQESSRIQMLGAVRATNDCLQCHEGNRGKLLGAFSYELTPMDDATAKR